MDATTRTRLARLVFITGTTLAVLWAVVGIRDLVLMFRGGVGGFGSADLVVALEYLVPTLVTALLARLAIDRDRTAVLLWRVFVTATLVPIGLLCLAAIGIASGV